MILIIGSGNIVHNLHAYAWDLHVVEPLEWAMRFDTQVRELLRTVNDAPLVNFEGLGRDAILSAPTPDHYLPMLYVISLRETPIRPVFRLKDSMEVQSLYADQDYNQGCDR